jgi:hypothetical protein
MTTIKQTRSHPILFMEWLLGCLDVVIFLEDAVWCPQQQTVFNKIMAVASSPLLWMMIPGPQALTLCPSNKGIHRGASEDTIEEWGSHCKPSQEWTLPASG